MDGLNCESLLRIENIEVEHRGAEFKRRAE